MWYTTYMKLEEQRGSRLYGRRPSQGIVGRNKTKRTAPPASQAQMPSTKGG